MINTYLIATSSSTNGFKKNVFSLNLINKSLKSKFYILFMFVYPKKYSTALLYITLFPKLSKISLNNFASSLDLLTTSEKSASDLNNKKMFIILLFEFFLIH